MRGVFFGLCLGCGAPPPGDVAPRPPSADRSAPAQAVDTHYVLVGGHVVGLGEVDVEIDGDTIVRVGAAHADDGLARVDVSGKWLAPAFIDSHVHLAYFGPVDLPAAGIAGAVDLAAPLEYLARDHGALAVIHAGPMLTAPGGYPTRGWGVDGYGLPVGSPRAAAAAIDRLADAGARVVKLPIEHGPRLDEATMIAAVERAHARGMKVAVHALGDREAALAARIGADVLAHAPVEPLREATIAAWSGRAVVGTLAAFGGAPTTVANLAALHEAGATVLYGTDLGNTQVAAIDPQELALLREAGLSPAEVLAAGTRAPAELWGFDRLGTIAPGKAASLLVLDADPLQDPLAITRASAVLVGGRLVPA